MIKETETEVIRQVEVMGTPFIIVGTAQDDTEAKEIYNIGKVSQVMIKFRELNKLDDIDKRMIAVIDKREGE